MYCPDCGNKLILIDTYTYIRQGNAGAKVLVNGFVYQCQDEDCMKGDWGGYFHTDEWFNVFMGRPVEYEYRYSYLGLPKF